MTSSTSSSRRPLAVTLAAIVAGMTLSMLLVRLFTWANGASAETILGRAMEARAALPEILDEDRDLVMAFGSSMTEAGFSARVFDREMEERGVEIRSFNFGFGGLNPYFQDYLARRIRDAFLERDRRLTLAILEFTPLQNTKARWNGARPIVDSYLTMLASDREIWELVLREPTRGLRTANIHYLRNDISAEMITWYFGGQWFGTGRPRSDVPEDEQARAKLEELGPELTRRFEEDYPDYEESEWNWAWQGAGTIPQERSEETLALFGEYYEALRNEKRMTEDRLWRIQCCDFENLDFEEELVAAFIRTVRVFQEFSDTVEVYLMPVNEDWLRRPPEAEERLSAVLRRIERETGVRIRNYERSPEITPEMFGDTTHLARYYGDVPFTKLLVEQYAPLLGGGD